MARGQGKPENVVAVGWVGDIHVQILGIAFAGAETFYFRALLDDEMIYISPDSYQTIEEAMQHAIEHFEPGAVGVLASDPDVTMFEVLNTLLAMGTPFGPIENMAQAIEWRHTLEGGLTKLEALREKVISDIETIEDFMASADGLQPGTMIALHNIQDVLEHDLSFMTTLSNRDIEVLTHFITTFG